MTWTVHLLQKSNNKKALCCAVIATALSLGLFFAKLTWHPSLFMMHIKKKSFICPPPANLTARNRQARLQWRFLFSLGEESCALRIPVLNK